MDSSVEFTFTLRLTLGLEGGLPTIGFCREGGLAVEALEAWFRMVMVTVVP